MTRSTTVTFPCRPPEVTYAREPSGAIATPRAPGGTGMLATTVRLTRSIAASRPAVEPLATTYARSPSRLSATARAGRPTSGRATTFLRPRSTTFTLVLPLATTARRADAAGAASAQANRVSVVQRAKRRICNRN